MKKIIFTSALVLTLAAALFVACKKDANPSTPGLYPSNPQSNDYAMRKNGLEIRVDNGHAFVANYMLLPDTTVIFNYEADTTLVGLQSELTIMVGSTPLTMTYDVDETIVAYKLNEHTKVIEAANTYKSSFTLLQSQTIANQFKTFAKMIMSSSPNYNRKTIQALFFYNAILNTIKRSLATSQSCGCTPSPSYFIGKSGFWCQEDVKLPTSIFLTAFDSIPPTDHNDSLQYAYLLEHQNEESVTMINMTETYISRAAFNEHIGAMYQYFQENPTEPVASVGCLQGSQIGCCGNYAGCCWYSHPLCAAHDLACINCDHWWCLSGCQPGFGGGGE